MMRLVGLLAILGALMVMPAQAQETGKITQAELDEMLADISNWGRWGEDDELGTLNLITPEKRVAAAALVREGISVSLAFDIQDIPGPAPIFEHVVAKSEFGGDMAAGDTYTMTFHGFTYSHMDGLPHFFRAGKMYNGFSIDDVTAEGANKLGIQNMKQGIFTRGILVDIPRLKGIPYMEPGTSIMPEDLEAWEQETGIRIASGDVVLIRTGRWARVADKGPWNFVAELAGLHPTVIPWLAERDIAVLGSDGVSDTYPSAVEGSQSPMHLLALIGLGMPLLDNLSLEDLTLEAINQNRWEFLFVGAPLRIPGGTGSPLNPIATF